MSLLRFLTSSLLFLALAAPVASAAGTSGGTAPGSTSTTLASGATGGSQPTGGAPTPAPSTAPAPAPTPTGPAGRNRADVPAPYLRLYRAAGRTYGVDWRILAAIGKNESDHGRSRAPGVHSGLNFARCCAGPMQFCTVRSCGNTWRAYAVDGNRDGLTNVYDPADAVPTAGRLVAALTRMVGTRTDLVLASYNAGPAYAMKHRRVPPYAETRRYVTKGVAYVRGL